VRRFYTSAELVRNEIPVTRMTQVWKGRCIWSSDDCNSHQFVSSPYWLKDVLLNAREWVSHARDRKRRDRNQSCHRHRIGSGGRMQIRKVYPTRSICVAPAGDMQAQSKAAPKKRQKTRRWTHHLPILKRILPLGRFPHGNMNTYSLP